ncbi:MAG: ABC transporter permease subunit [Anaerolineales bacterium]|jgi:ABC-2 type transport system permease protein
MEKIWEIVRKEWSEVFKNRFVLFAVAFMPLIFTIIPLAILYSMGGSAEATQLAESMDAVPKEYAAMCGDLTGQDCAQYFILSQFLVLFLMMPIIIPVTIASYSIVGEKTTRTLEPVLATPITTIELLLGKALAGVIPAMAVTWFSYGVFAIGTYILAASPLITKQLFNPLWLLAIFVVAPLLSIAGVSLAVMISSRVNDPRVAEQLSSLVVLPLVAIFMGQSFGLIQVNQTVVIWFTLGLLVIDALLLFFATQLFQRENILTRWK